MTVLKRIGKKTSQPKNARFASANLHHLWYQLDLNLSFDEFATNSIVHIVLLYGRDTLLIRAEDMSLIATKSHLFSGSNFLAVNW